MEIGSPNVTFRDCTVSSPNRDGMYVIGGSATDGVTVENCTFETDGTALQFTTEGSNHDICHNRFEGDVAWTDPLSDVLWMGNRHEGAVDAGPMDDWNVLANRGFDALD